MIIDIYKRFEKAGDRLKAHCFKCNKTSYHSNAKSNILELDSNNYLKQLTFECSKCKAKSMVSKESRSTHQKYRFFLSSIITLSAEYIYTSKGLVLSSIRLVNADSDHEFLEVSLENDINWKDIPGLMIYLEDSRILE